MSTKPLVELLESPNVFHYKKEWLDTHILEERKLLEVFSFGTVKDVQPSMGLSSLSLRKLQKLTIMSMCESYRRITYAQVVSQCQLADDSEVEQLFMEMNSVMVFEIDCVAKFVEIKKCLDSRDVYGEERELMVLQQAPNKTKQGLLTDLLRWKTKLNLDICSSA